MGLEIGMAFLVIVILLAFAFYLLRLRAALIRLRNEAARALSNFEAQIKQRNDLIPTLIETCRGYMGSGQEPLQALAAARSAYGNAKTVAEKAGCEQGMQQRLSALFQEVERHRELKINNSYQRLRSRFAEIGREVDGNREAVNQAVDRYNRRLSAFPASWMGSWLGLKPKSRVDASVAGVTKGGAP